METRGLEWPTSDLNLFEIKRSAFRDAREPYGRVKLAKCSLGGGFFRAAALFEFIFLVFDVLVLFFFRFQALDGPKVTNGPAPLFDWLIVGHYQASAVPIAPCRIPCP